MGPVSTWEAVLLGILAVLLVLWLAPGVKASLRGQRKADAGEWRSVLWPIGLVVLFVLLLVALVRAG